MEWLGWEVNPCFKAYLSSFICLLLLFLLLIWRVWVWDGLDWMCLGWNGYRCLCFCPTQENQSGSDKKERGRNPVLNFERVFLWIVCLNLKKKEKSNFFGKDFKGSPSFGRVLIHSNTYIHHLQRKWTISSFLFNFLVVKV